MLGLFSSNCREFSISFELIISFIENLLIGICLHVDTTIKYFHIGDQKKTLFLNPCVRTIHIILFLKTNKKLILSYSIHYTRIVDSSQWLQ